MAAADTPSPLICYIGGRALTLCWKLGKKASQACAPTCTRADRTMWGTWRLQTGCTRCPSSHLRCWPLLALSGKLKLESGKKQEGFALCCYLQCQQQPKQISRCPNSRARASEPASQLFTIYLSLISS